MLNKIKDDIGWPLGIRGTVRKHKQEGRVSSGNQSSEGVAVWKDRPILHFFVANDKNVVGYDEEELEARFERSVRKSIETYSRNHSLPSKKIPFSEGALPLLHLFPAEYYLHGHDNVFTKYEGESTFLEGNMPKRYAGFHPDGVFEVTFSDFQRIYREIIEPVREQTKALEVLDDDVTKMATFYFEESSVDDHQRYFKGITFYQKHISEMILSQFRIKRISRKKIESLLKDRPAHQEDFLQRYRVDLIKNIYFDVLYKAFSEKIVNDIRRRFGG